VVAQPDAAAPAGFPPMQTLMTMVDPPTEQERAAADAALMSRHQSPAIPGMVFLTPGGPVVVDKGLTRLGETVTVTVTGPLDEPDADTPAVVGP
jgi:hypothetical protein